VFVAVYLLLSQAEPGYNFLITLDVFSAYILKQCRPGPDHFQQTASGCVVFAMNLEMLGKVIDPFRQYSNLYFGRARISLVSLKIADNFGFFLLG
jgi:hypothetical protein